MTAAPRDRRDLAARWAPTLNLPIESAASFVGAGDRRKMASRGIALPDGSFPIPDVPHLRSAIKLARTPTHRAHIKKRAKALGATKLIPKEWTD